VAPVISQASIITVEFDVSVNSMRDGSYQNIPFQPLLHQYASITFDDALSSVDRYTSTDNIIMQHVINSYGAANQAQIVSPMAYLTDANPLISSAVTTTSSVTSMLWYGHAPSDYSQVSFAHQVGASLTSYSDVYKYPPYSYEGESWQRTVSIFSAVDYLGFFDQAALENYDFGYENLLTYYRNMWSLGEIFTYSDGYNYSNRPSLLSSGYTWSGSAIITNILVSQSNEIPEPSDVTLFLTGLLALIFASMKSSTRSKLRR
jgi:hypothetical protein